MKFTNLVKLLNVPTVKLKDKKNCKKQKKRGLQNSKTNNQNAIIYSAYFSDVIGTVIKSSFSVPLFLFARMSFFYPCLVMLIFRISGFCSLSFSIEGIEDEGTLDIEVVHFHC